MKQQRGLTLIELIVVMSVISVMTILMMNFVATRIADNAVKNAQSELQLQTQLALDDINKEIRLSANVDGQNRWEDEYGPIIGNPYSWSSNSNTLILADPTINQNNEVVFEDPQAYISYKDNVIYYVDSTTHTLYKRILAAPVEDNKRQTTCPPGTANCPSDDPLLAANVESFSVDYFNANDEPVPPEDARSVRVTLRVSREVFNKVLVVEESIRSVFRNE